MRLTVIHSKGPVMLAVLCILSLPGPARASVKSGVFGNISSMGYVRQYIQVLPSQQYAVLKQGDYFAAEPFEGGAITRKNILTFAKPQTPVIVTARHRELPFVFAESDVVEGWVREDNLIPVSEHALRQFILDPVVILKKNLSIGGIRYPIASRLPLVRETKTGFVVKITGEGGVPAECNIRKKDATKPLQMNSRTLTQTASLFLKKPYAWGNSDSGWDCSGLLMDYFSFFDIKIPRNSYQQISYFEQDYVAGEAGTGKTALLKAAEPYRTLLYFPGHIMLYTGKKGREFQSFQAIGSLGRKKLHRVGYFPLVRTGLLNRVTRIGYINPAKGAELSKAWLENRTADKIH